MVAIAGEKDTEIPIKIASPRHLKFVSKSAFSEFIFLVKQLHLPMFK